MICALREKNGLCGHYQCEFPDETGHRQKCVDLIVYMNSDGYVEMVFCNRGEGCLTKCLYSWTEADKLRIKRTYSNARGSNRRLTTTKTIVL